MRRGRCAWLAVACAAAVASMACRRASGSAPDDARRAIAPDSLTGMVVMTGVAALPRTMLTFDDGSSAVELDGSESLSRVAGLRVAVVGVRVGKRLTVSHFTVVAANGVSATDGMLSAEGDALVIVSADGRRHPLVSPSPALRAATGHRVWVSGPLDRTPVAYGIIE